MDDFSIDSIKKMDLNIEFSILTEWNFHCVYHTGINKQTNFKINKIEVDPSIDLMKLNDDKQLN